MNVRKIALKHFGRFVEPFEVELAVEQPNLLAGPNGSGKSTLLAAVASAFTVPATSASQEIQRWQPWQSALHPWVQVEFEHRGQRWRLSKEYTFSPRGQALLERPGNDGWVPEAEGRNVEERLAELFGGERGALLLAGVLWARQNQMGSIPLEGTVQERIRRSLGAQIRTPAVDRVLAEVERLYEADWTPTGRLARGSPLRALQGQAAERRQRVQSVRERLDALERDRESFQTLREGAAALEVEIGRLDQRIRELRLQAAQRAEAEKRRLEITNALQAARQERDRAEAVLQQRRSLAGELQAAGERLRELEQRLEQARGEAGRAEEALVGARTAVAVKIGEAEAALQRLNAPPRRVLDELARLDQRLRELEAKLEGALLHVRLELERDARIEVQKGSPQGVIEGREGASVEISGSPEIEMAVPGLGRMRIWGPAESAASLQEQIEGLRAERERVAGVWQGEAVDELERRRREADDLERELEALRRARQAHEREESAEALALRGARQAAADLERQQRAAQDALARLEEQQRALSADPRGEAELQRASQEAALRIAVEEARLRDAETELEALPAEAAQLLAQAEAERETALQKREQALESVNTLRGRILALQGEGLYAQLAAEEEALAAAEEELRAAELRAQANKLLRDMLGVVLKEAEQQILPKLEERTLDVLGRINGFFGGLELDSGRWTPAQVHPAAAPGVKVEPERISGGEQEQLYLALRLALADVLTEDEPHLVVLDDVLLATDAARLERILELIEERRRRMQLLILTCHPERFAGLADCRLIRLGEASAVR